MLRAVFDIMPGITFVKNKEFVYVAASQQFAKRVGKNAAKEKD